MTENVELCIVLAVVYVKKKEYGRHLRGKSEQGREQKQTRTQKGGMGEKRVGP